jgi:hypothetical protein
VNVIEIQVKSTDRTGQGYNAARDGSKQVKKEMSDLQRVGVAASAAIVAGFAAIAVGSAKAAAGLEQAVGGTEAVFGSAGDVIDDFAKRSAESMGLSEREFREATTFIGGNLKRLGFETDDAAQKSIELTQVGADLAATYGGTTREAVEALAAAFRGEADPAERFNLGLKIGAQNAKAVEMGLAASTAEVDDNARAQATLALIMEQSADAQGQFAREADTAAGQAQIVSAQFEDMQAQLGQKLLPVMVKAGQVMSAVMGSGAASAGTAVGALGLAAVLAAPKLAELNMKSSQLTGGFRTMSRVAGAAGAAGAIVGLVGTLKSMDDANAARMAEENAQAFLALGDGIDESAVAALKFLDSFGGDGIQGTFDVLNESNAEAAKRFIETAEAAGVSKDTLNEMRDALDSKAAADRQSADDADANNAAIEETASLSDQAADSVDNLADELDKLFGATFSVEEATDKMHSALIDLREQLKDNSEGLSGYSAEQIANREAVREAISAHFDLVNAMVEQGATADQVKARNAAFKEELVRVLRQAGATEDEIRVYTAALDAVPQKVRTDVGMTGLLGSFRSIEELKARIASIPASKVIAISTRIRDTSGAALAAINAGRASGGVVGAQGGGPRSGLTWVGEHGPELADLPPGTRVHSNAMSQMIAGRGGGDGGPVVVQFVPSGNALVDQLLQLLQENIRVSYGGDVQAALGRGAA